MNQEFFEYAMKLMDSWTPSDWEASLKDFGFQVRRKVVLLDSDRIDPEFEEQISKIQIGEKWLWEYEFNKAARDAEYRAANDSSYALAA